MRLHQIHLVDNLSFLAFLLAESVLMFSHGTIHTCTYNNTIHTWWKTHLWLSVFGTFSVFAIEERIMLFKVLIYSQPTYGNCSSEGNLKIMPTLSHLFAHHARMHAHCIRTPLFYAGTSLIFGNICVCIYFYIKICSWQIPISIRGDPMMSPPTLHMN